MPAFILDIDVVFDDSMAVGSPNVWSESISYKAEVNSNETFSTLFAHVRRFYLELSNNYLKGTPAPVAINGYIERGSYKGKGLNLQSNVSEVIKSGERIQVSIVVNQRVGCCTIC